MTTGAMTQASTRPDDGRLPALIDRACQRLAQARTSAEVLEAKAIAEAALHYARVTKAANETHADCLRMIVRAEMRMADEIDKGQSEGTIASGGRRPKASEILTVSDLARDREQLREWREVRDAGPEVVEQAIQEALSEGRAPTKTDIQRAIKGESKPHVSHNSGENEWYTPEPYIVAARKVLGGIDLDPASSKEANRVVKAKEFYSIDDDGLTQRWRGRVWMNPPYAQPLVAQFCQKLVESVKAKDVPCAIVLVNNATETAWFQSVAELSSATCHLAGRVKFWSPPKESSQPLQGQAVLYIGPKWATFHPVFADLGTVWVKP